MVLGLKPGFISHPTASSVGECSCNPDPVGGFPGVCRAECA